MLGIREVKQSFSKYLNRVAYGRERLIIHSRGEPKAALISIEDLHRLEAAEAAQTGLVEAWDGRPYTPAAPVIINRGPRAVSELLIENREPDWTAYFTPAAQP